MISVQRVAATFNKLQYDMIILNIFFVSLNQLVWHNIINVIPRVTIQSLIQSTLIYKVTNKSSGTAQDKYCVQDTHVDVLIRFLPTKLTRFSQKVNKGHGDGSIYIQNQVAPFGRGDLLNIQCVIKEWRFWKLCSDEVFDYCNSRIGIFQGFYAMSDTTDVLICLFHFHYKFLRSFVRIICSRELCCCIV